MDRSWEKVRNHLKSELGKDIFKNWIEAICFKKIEKNVAYFQVPSTFIANWVDRNYGDKIINSFNRMIFKHI